MFYLPLQMVVYTRGYNTSIHKLFLRNSNQHNRILRMYKTPRLTQGNITINMLHPLTPAAPQFVLAFLWRKTLDKPWPFQLYHFERHYESLPE